MVLKDRPSTHAAVVTPSDANLFLTNLGMDTGEVEAAVRAVISRAFSEKRGFTFSPDQHVIETLSAGASIDSVQEHLSALRIRAIEAVADGDHTDEQRLKDDARVASRLVRAFGLLHRAIVATGQTQLTQRRFVLIREAPGTSGSLSNGFGPPVIARVGKGPQWVETPTIYLPLRIFDLLATYGPELGEELFESLVLLLNVEERAIETGYAHTEQLTKEEKTVLQRLVDALVETAPVEEVEREEVPVPKPVPVRPFTKKNREQYLRGLNARSRGSENLDYTSGTKTIDTLEKLARRYKKSHDRDSLREVVRLLVAASGHDLHEVRNRANIALERVFAPKDYDAPLASSFTGIRAGEQYHFAFPLAKGKATYILRLFHATPVGSVIVEGDIAYDDVELELDAVRGVYVADVTFPQIGSYDYLVYRRTNKSFQWVTQRRCSGRMNVLPDISGEIVLEIFPDIHGHTRMYWRDTDGHPGLVYNESGEIIRLGRFSDVTAHLKDLKTRYQITAIYLLGVQQRGSNREDWAAEATSPSPFAPMSLTVFEPALGGETEFRELVKTAHDFDIRVIVDTIPHLNRKATEIPDDWRVRCYDDGGNLVVRASTDGKFGSWNDGALMNYRKFEVWEWLAGSVVKLVKEFDIDGIRFDSAHSVPIMMKKNNYPFQFSRQRSVEELVEGTIIVNDREDDQLITTGYYDSSCRELIANPFQTYFVGEIQRAVRETGKEFFVYLAECYWGRERYLAKSGIIPYNSALFKICENIIHGKTDVREVYHLYDDYYPHALPPGTELLGILGNHDERRALNTFGQRGLAAAVGLTSFMSHMIMDYEGSAEGEGWKVFLDNIYVNWNQFEFASHRSVERFYETMYEFHRTHRGTGYLVWANNPMVAAALKFSDSDITLGIFNFSNENQACSIQFDNPMLPLEDEGYYRIVDSLYSSVTNHYNYYTGRELRISRLHTVVSYTDRVKFLTIERIAAPQELYVEFLRDSFFRMCAMDRKADFTCNFAFREITDHLESYDIFAAFLRDRVVPVFDEQSSRFLELGLKRAIFYAQKNGIKRGTELLDFVERLASDRNERLRGIGASLELHNERAPVVFISAEAEPFSKYGGLANVVYELPRELALLGEDVCVITPMYRFGDEKSRNKMERARKKYNVTYTGVNVKFYLQNSEYEVGVFSGVVDGVRYFLLDHHEFFDGLYWGYTSVERIRRRAGFARAAAEVIARFDLRPNFTFTNDAYAGVFNGIVRLDPYYASSLAFMRNSFIHLIHNGGWQYFDSYERYEEGFDLYQIFNLPGWKSGDFADPVRSEKINCMAAGIRCADQVITVSPSYARQLTVASDGLEHLLSDVVGINNAIGQDFARQMEKRFRDSGLVKTYYPKLIELAGKDTKLKDKLQKRYPEILAGPDACNALHGQRKNIVTRMRNKLLMQIQEGLAVDPDVVVFSMIHRIVDQKGFQLLLEASEGVFRTLGYQGIVAGPVSHGDQKAEEIARGLSMMAGYYPGSVAVHIGFHDVSIPLLASDVFLMPSMYEPGGISQLEALACGCLVVARATGGLRDTVFPVRKVGKSIGGNGFLFTDFTPTAFFDAMERCAGFFKRSDEEAIQSVRDVAQNSLGYWDRSASRYIEEIYGLKEIVRAETTGNGTGKKRKPRV